MTEHGERASLEGRDARTMSADELIAAYRKMHGKNPTSVQVARLQKSRQGSIFTAERRSDTPPLRSANPRGMRWQRIGQSEGGDIVTAHELLDEDGVSHGEVLTHKNGDAHAYHYDEEDDAPHKIGVFLNVHDAREAVNHVEHTGGFHDERAEGGRKIHHWKHGWIKID